MSHLENHGKVKRSLRRSGDIEIPMDPEFYDRLHDKIMAGIEDKEIQPVSCVQKPIKVVKQNWRGWAQLALGLFLVLGLGISSSQFFQSAFYSTRTVQLVQNEKQILIQAIDSPTVFSTSLLSSESESDFMQDIASRTLDQYGADQLKEILN